MIEVHERLFVGGELDEQQIRGMEGWYVIHACKEPYHRQALGYTGRAAAKDHPEYLMAVRPGRLILNLVDVDNVAYIGAALVDAALAAIGENLPTRKVLVHCNQGASRSPSLALLYLAQNTDQFRGLDHAAGVTRFRTLYAPYDPAKGMADYVRINWDRYNRA